MIILFIILGLIGFCLIGIVIAGYFGFTFIKNTALPYAGCMINFEVTRDALVEYAQSHDGKFPNAATWQDDIKDIVGKRLKDLGDQDMIQTLKPDGEWGCRIDASHSTGIAFNADLSGKKMLELKEPWSTPLVFEVPAPKRNAAQKYAPIPKDQSPKMMGEPRGWFVANVQGEIIPPNAGGNWRGRIETRSSSGSDSSENKDSGDSP